MELQMSSAVQEKEEHSRESNKALWTRDYLSSWTREACCSWKGIGCDNITRHVVKINLSREPMEGASLGGDISTSLLDLNHIQYLDLSWNSFEGLQIPEFLGSLTGLRYLNLSNAGLTGDVPRQLGKQSTLQYLDIGGISLDTENLDWISSLSVLEVLDMSWVDLNKASNWLQAMNTLHSLSVLILSDCGLDSINPLPVVNFSSLTVLHLSENQFVSPTFDCSSSGPTSVSVRGSSSLSYLDMSGNSLKGIVSGKHFANLTRLKYLHASSNSFTLQVGSDWNPPFQLEILKMGYWQLGPLFPAWLQTQKDQMDLDISRVSIKDAIPSWFWSLNLDYINLADNRIYGTVPSLPTAYQIYLCSNKFTGPLPRISSKTFSLDLSHNSFNGSLSPILCQQNNEENILWSLDLSGNILSGELPDCWASWTLLMVLTSQNNILTGHLPSSMGSLLQLRSLHLHNNSLSGTLPPSMQGCKSLSVVDLGENEFSGSIPMWVGKNLSYGFTDTASLVVKSSEYEYGGSLPLLTGLIDLSCNNLSSEIPEELTGLQGLMFLNLSVNHLEGQLPMEIGAMTSLESLDLSRNKLSGVIPQSVAGISFLSHLNVSHNNFSDRIPSGTQIQGFNASCFIGNLELCGPHLRETCIGDDLSEVPTPGSADEEDDDD
ncbi:receptor-like protein EIX2 [Vitis riparia]|uniref:receptor-like protein EIX2 n=1 Tax=Vitis riparia TaxID=96939 RepID=UPI00155AF1AA|nr:receptor-like protein EIX2 [Vitis riparia]